jgi:hypothetical protein
MARNIAIGAATLAGTTINSIYAVKYHILGEDVEVSGHIDGNTAMMISTLNVLGKPFYDELKKNKISFSNDIEAYLERKFREIERDEKIEEVLKAKDEK